MIRRLMAHRIDISPMTNIKQEIAFKPEEI